MSIEVNNIQITTMSFPSGSHKILDQQLIEAAIMKLKEKHVMHAKMIEKLGHMDQTLKAWSKCKEIIHDKYQKLLDRGTAFQTSASQGYRTTFNATTDTP